MKTTAIFAELVVVGIQACVWLLLLAVAVLGTGWLQWAGELASNATTLVTLAVVAMAYVMGIVFDELWDALSEPLECRVFHRTRKKDCSESMWDMQARVLVRAPHLEDALDYQRRRIRVLRSSVFSLPLTAICALVRLLVRHRDLGQHAVDHFFYFDIFQVGCHIQFFGGDGRCPVHEGGCAILVK